LSAQVDVSGWSSGQERLQGEHTLLVLAHPHAAPVDMLFCLQALLENPDAQAADTAGLQLAAALGFAVYGFKEWKRLPLGEHTEDQDL
jgi:hypothetical protein